MSRWLVRLSGRSPALLGGVAEAPAGIHAATAFLDVGSGQPRLLLPGTAFRGVLRDAFRRFAGAKGAPCSLADGCSCPTCRLFGRPDRSGGLWVRSALAARARRHLAPGVALDRQTRTAARAEGSFWIEERGLADFELDVVCEATLSSDDLALLEDFWAWLELVGLSLGRRKSAGAGQFAVEVLASPPASRFPPPPLAGSEETPQRYLLRVTLLEPARLVGHRQRAFYRDGLEVIPAATLRGALGWALERLGAGSAAEDLFIKRPISLTPAFPVGPNDRTPIPPWLSRWCCDGDPSHIVDGALYRVAHVLAGTWSWSPRACPDCGCELREFEPGSPPPLVLGHVTMDPTHRRAKRGELHYQVALAPGTALAAEVLARRSQAAALHALETVLIGGRRARGMGLAQVELQDLPPLPPLRDRIAATARRLTDLGAHDHDVAVLGFLTDAAVERPLRDILGDAGLEVLTGEVRSIVRGGWDERSGRMRPLRRLLQAGSWLAVRIGSDRALAELERLERDGIPDPEGVAPFLLRVRHDWEVVAMIGETSPATGTDIDELVREARALCRKHARNLPARAGLQTLLRFAQGTASVEEIVLFIEYQASRDQLRKAKDFLTEAATLIADRFPGDPEQARRFLGLLVRAGNVEAKQDVQSHTSGGRRGRR